MGKLKKGRHQICLPQIIVMEKVLELQKNIFNNLFVNKDMSLTSKMLLTAAGICIYSIRQRKKEIDSQRPDSRNLSFKVKSSLNTYLYT